MKKLLIFLLLSVSLIGLAYAELLGVVDKDKKEALNVFIVKSEGDAFPIVISPFEVVGNAEQGATIANIIRDNLNRSGQFNALSSSNVITNKIDFSYWKNQGNCLLYTSDAADE